MKDLLLWNDLISVLLSLEFPSLNACLLGIPIYDWQESEKYIRTAGIACTMPISEWMTSCLPAPAPASLPPFLSCMHAHARLLPLRHSFMHVTNQPAVRVMSFLVKLKHAYACMLCNMHRCPAIVLCHVLCFIPYLYHIYALYDYTSTVRALRRAQPVNVLLQITWVSIFFA